MRINSVNQQPSFTGEYARINGFWRDLANNGKRVARRVIKQDYNASTERRILSVEAADVEINIPRYNYRGKLTIPFVFTDYPAKDFHMKTDCLSYDKAQNNYFKNTFWFGGKIKFIDGIEVKSVDNIDSVL